MKPLLGLKDTQNAILSLADKIAAARYFGFPNIEVHDDGYHLIDPQERGETPSRRITRDFDELAYWVFSHTTSQMAFDWAKENAKAGGDMRRLAFPKKVELMQTLEPAFGERAKREIEEILKRAPYGAA